MHLSNDLLERQRLTALRGAFVSWGNLLRKAVTNYLDIETTELTVDYFVKRDSQDEKAVRAGVFMVEQLENGAGYTSFLGSADSEIQFEVFLKQLLKNGSIYEKLTEENHKDTCDCSCYDCLRDYYNQKYHEMLDWRLGLDLAQIAANNSYVPSIMDKSSYWYNLLLSRIEALKGQNSEEINIYPQTESFIITINNEIIILAHPFWSKQKISKLATEYGYPDARIVYVNTFIQNLKL